MPAPAQTPGFWVLAALVDQWGADCVAAMLACGLDPADFGSYNEVNEKIRAAKDKVAKWEAAKRMNKGRPPQPVPPAERAKAMRDAGGPPSAKDFELSKCQAGHMMQDASARKTRYGPKGGRKSSNRNDRCANIVDGYSQDHVPCFPMAKCGADDKKLKKTPHKEDVHERVGDVEDSQAAKRQKQSGLKNNDERGLDYSKTKRRNDQQKRNRELVKAKVDSQHRSKAQTRATQARSAYQSANPSATSAGNSGGAGGAKDGKVPVPSAGAPTADVMNKAADCITEQSNLAEDKMYADCAAKAGENAATAASKAHQDKVKELAAKYEGIQKDFDNKQFWKVDKNYGKALQKRRDARDAYYKAASLDCYAKQGQKIKKGKGNTSGKIPGGSFNANTPPKKAGVNPKVTPHPSNVPPPSPTATPPATGPSNGATL